MQISDSSSRILAGLLEARTGQPLTMSRRWRIETALSTLLRERGIAGLDELITILVMGKEPSLSQKVVEALLNNETYFFRDRAPFDVLQRKALDELAQRRQKSKRLRIWSGRAARRPGGLFASDAVCRAARTMARMDDRYPGHRCIDQLRRSRTGRRLQPVCEVQRGLGINQMIKWVEETSDGWRAIEALRKPVRFQVHNLLEPAPHPGGFDIILCRNVLLYLSPEKKTLAFERIAGAMADDGWLMLGAGETVIGQTVKLGADLNARGLYRLVGDGDRVEKRAGLERRTVVRG